MTSGNHLTTCTAYCAKTHCKCGRDARHGEKTCGPYCSLRVTR